MRRYRCAAADCRWDGLIAAGSFAGSGQASTRTRWRRALPFAAAGLAFAVVAAVAVRMIDANAPAKRPAPSAQTVPAGESYFGEPLPKSHPLLLLARASGDVALGGPKPGVPAPARPASATQVLSALQSASGNPDGLALRQRCVWGKPGGDPYRGTVAQALNAARLPPEVVKKVVAKVKAREVTDRLVITNATIKAQNSEREFDPNSIAMTHGMTLCLGTRVNFVADHHELADLYQVSDDAGREYSVMVPDVCGNVSVLGARGELDEGSVLGARAELDAQSVPEPGTLASVLAALVALAWWSRRRVPA